MADKKHQLKLDENYYVCLANDLILAKQKTMSIWASRIINFLVMQIVGNETLADELKTHTVRIQDLAQFIGVAPTGQLYGDIKNAVQEIMETVVEIGASNPQMPWKMFHWMSVAEYDGSGTLTLSLSNEVKPYLYELKDRGFFTQFQIKEILPMTSFYAIRLYQYITMVDNKNRHSTDSIELSILELRELLECTDKFKQIVQLKEKVIERAIKQININPNSKYWIDVDYIKTGRSVTHVRFGIHEAKPRRDYIGATND